MNEGGAREPEGGAIGKNGALHRARPMWAWPKGCVGSKGLLGVARMLYVKGRNHFWGAWAEGWIGLFHLGRGHVRGVVR